MNLDLSSIVPPSRIYLRPTIIHIRDTRVDRSIRIDLTLLDEEHWKGIVEEGASFNY